MATNLIQLFFASNRQSYHFAGSFQINFNMEKNIEADIFVSFPIATVCYVNTPIVLHDFLKCIYNYFLCACRYTNYTMCFKVYKMCNTDGVIRCRKCTTQTKTSYGREARNNQSNRRIVADRKRSSTYYLDEVSSGLARMCATSLNFCTVYLYCHGEKTQKWHVLNSNYAKMPEYFSEDILMVNTSMQTVQIQDRSHIVHVQNQNK